MKNKMIACREGKNDILHDGYLFILHLLPPRQAFTLHIILWSGDIKHIFKCLSADSRDYFFLENIILSAIGLKFQKFLLLFHFFFWAGPDILVFGFHAIRNKRKNRFWPMYISLQINLVVFIHVHLPHYFHLPNVEFINHMI